MQIFVQYPPSQQTQRKHDQS